MAKRKAKLKHGTRDYAKPRSSVTLAQSSWDQGAAGAANRDRLVVEERPHIDPVTGKRSNPNDVRGVRRETWVEIYAGKKPAVLSDRQANAARSLYAAAQGKLRDDPLSAIRVDMTAELVDHQGAAFDKRRDFHRMWEMIPGFARPVIERVVIEDKPVWSRIGAARERHIERLQNGLEALADAMDGRTQRRAAE